MKITDRKELDDFLKKLNAEFLKKRTSGNHRKFWEEYLVHLEKGEKEFEITVIKEIQGFVANEQEVVVNSDYYTMEIIDYALENKCSAREERPLKRDSIPFGEVHFIADFFKYKIGL